MMLIPLFFGFIMSYDISQMSNEFAFKLYNPISRRTNFDNLVFSPYSIYMTLGLLLGGTDNESRKQILSLLELESWISKADERKFHNDILEFSKSLDSKKKALSLANGIFVSDSFTILESYTALAKEFYNTEILRGKFPSPADEEINSWVSEKSGGIIKKLVDKLDAQTVLVLVNTIFFKNTWKERFDDRDTVSHQFALLNEIDYSYGRYATQMMSAEVSALYGDHSFGTVKFETLELEFGNSVSTQKKNDKDIGGPNRNMVVNNLPFLKLINYEKNEISQSFIYPCVTTRKTYLFFPEETYNLCPNGSQIECYVDGKTDDEIVIVNSSLNLNKNLEDNDFFDNDPGGQFLYFFNSRTGMQVRMIELGCRVKNSKSSFFEVGCLHILTSSRRINQHQLLVSGVCGVNRESFGGNIIEESARFLLYDLKDKIKRLVDMNLEIETTKLKEFWGSGCLDECFSKCSGELRFFMRCRDRVISKFGRISTASLVMITGLPKLDIKENEDLKERIEFLVEKYKHFKFVVKVKEEKISIFRSMLI